MECDPRSQWAIHSSSIVFNRATMYLRCYGHQLTSWIVAKLTCITLEPCSPWQVIHVTFNCMLLTRAIYKAVTHCKFSDFFHLLATMILPVSATSIISSWTPTAPAKKITATKTTIPSTSSTGKATERIVPTATLNVLDSATVVDRGNTCSSLLLNATFKTHLRCISKCVANKTTLKDE